MRLEKNLAQENVQSTELSTDEEMGWNSWGPWYFQNH
jgi:hypothetical protein